MYCQKCRSPLKLHPSLEDQLNSAAINLLLGPNSSNSAKSNILAKSSFPSERREYYDRAAQGNHSAVFKRTVPGITSGAHRLSRQAIQNPAESYVLLTESQVVSPHQHAEQSQGQDNRGAKPQQRPLGVDEAGENSLSQRMKVSSRIFEVLSARSDIDHPICSECTEMILENLQKRLNNTSRERDAYVKYLKEVNNSIPSAEELAQAEKELAEIKAEEERALNELKEAEREQEELQREIRKLEDESRQLDEEETAFWSSRNEFALSLAEFQNERDSVNLQYDHDAKQLERLQRTNVYNDTFCIGHDGYFGTINGLRLGRLPNQPVDWTEINAAWGQTLLLLATIAEKLNFSFRGYRLKPLGSHSKIERIEPSSSSHPDSRDNVKVVSLDLFSSGDLPIGRMFMHRRFDQGMVAFLECLRQLGEYVKSKDSNLVLPYTINKDKIGDACIRLAFNQDEAWTKACKYTLTCAKFLLAHASNIGHSRTALA